MNASGAPASILDDRMLRFLLKEVGRRNAVILFVTLGIMSMLDLAGIALVFPFLKVVTNPSSASPVLSKLGLEWLAAGGDQFRLVAAMSLLLASCYIAKTWIQARLVRMQMRLLARSTGRLTEDLTARVLHARYSTFQETPASEIASTISVAPHASLALSALLQAGNDALLLSLLFLAGVLYSPVAAVTALFIGGAVVLLVHHFVIRKSARVALQQRGVDSRRYRLLFSMASAIRDIKIMGLEALFAERNHAVTSEYAELSWRYNYYNALPRLLIEMFALLAIVGLTLAIVGSGMPLSQAGPMLGLVVVAAMRAIPSFTRLLGAVNVFSGSGQYVELLMALREKLAGQAVPKDGVGLDFQESIELRDVRFGYEGVNVLDGVSLTLGARETIGIVGSSGAGKTTLLDIMTGLQRADSGTFLCDGKPFDPFTRSGLHAIIGYVPQAITLLDESIAFNVSFADGADVERVERALASANLAGLVASLPDGLATRVGENGLRLSGGQRQRIGIARALYLAPRILVFDEATSSLDGVSERELVAEIERLRSQLAVVIVAHRLATVQGCDRIYVLSGGRVEDCGTHKELILRSPTYRALYSSQAAESAT